MKTCCGRCVIPSLPAMQKHGAIVCWIVDDTGFPKKGSHSVGVTRQYCGQVGKQDNCRVAVSLSVATWSSSLPIAYRLYLPEVWASDNQRRKQAGVPYEIEFQTKPQIALDQIREAVNDGVPRGIVVADAGYGVDSRFRSGVADLGLNYVVGIQSSVSVWKPGTEPLPPLPRQADGPATPTAAPGFGSSTRISQTSGAVIAVRIVEDHHMATRCTLQTSLPLCRTPRSVLHIVTTGRPNPIRKSGWLSNGLKKNPSRPNTGVSTLPPPNQTRGIWWLSPNNAGSSSAIIRN